MWAYSGYNVQGSAGLCCAEIKLPLFTSGKKKKKPLSQAEVDMYFKVDYIISSFIWREFGQAKYSWLSLPVHVMYY